MSPRTISAAKMTETTQLRRLTMLGDATIIWATAILAGVLLAMALAVWVEHQITGAPDGPSGGEAHRIRAN
jgi:hypothetical protein